MTIRKDLAGQNYQYGEKNFLHLEKKNKAKDNLISLKQVLNSYEKVEINRINLLM